MNDVLRRIEREALDDGREGSLAADEREVSAKTKGHGFGLARWIDPAKAIELREGSSAEVEALAIDAVWIIVDLDVGYGLRRLLDASNLAEVDVVAESADEGILLREFRKIAVGEARQGEEDSRSRDQHSEHDGRGHARNGESEECEGSATPTVP